eukprot:scaffold176278_cov30-Tisochrysis_lutea.AAC.2
MVDGPASAIQMLYYYSTATTSLRLSRCIFLAPAYWLSSCQPQALSQELRLRPAPLRPSPPCLPCHHLLSFSPIG